MFIDMSDGCWYMDQNTWNTIPVSEHKITLNNRVIEHWIIKQKQMVQNRTELNEWETNNSDNNSRHIGNEHD